MTNRLADATSPYLQQHADNPVDWRPWCEEALETARRENKPILLSIGYSACHWCHVMAHESFEDEATAAVMNELFVNIKVDREERPDLDRIYQDAHYLLSHADMAGFSLQDQQRLALLVRAHRRKFPVKLFAALPPAEAKRLERLAMLLRLAVLLYRSREDRDIPLKRVKGRKNGLKLAFEDDWLAQNQLARADLLAERELLQAAGLELVLEEA